MRNLSKVRAIKNIVPIIFLLVFGRSSESATVKNDIQLTVTFGDKTSVLHIWQDSGEKKFTFDQTGHGQKSNKLTDSDFAYFVELAQKIQNQKSQTVQGCPRRNVELLFGNKKRTSCLHSKLPIGKSFDQLMTAAAVLNLE